ncbi:ATP-binding protein [Mycobacterium nebraskense]|uniref:ATP-binding protein n=1 Tax=Mycobacterium nebraskense TaxID=244292 RepID=UPI001FC8FF73|nr:ATP-binding protein [Mycobacterium nebraskense]
MTTNQAAPAPAAAKVAQAFSGIRDVDIHVGGDAGQGQRWPGGPYRKIEMGAIAAIAGPALWWIDSHHAGTTWPVLLAAAILTAVTVSLMRLLIPRGRPSLSTRIQFARNIFRPPHVTSSPLRDQRDDLAARIDDTIDPPTRVDGNLVFTKNGVYAEFLLDGRPVSMRPLRTHEHAAELTRNLGRHLPSGAQIRGLLVADDTKAILRGMVGAHADKPAWVDQCRAWEPTINAPSKTLTTGFTGPVRQRFWLTVPVDAGTAGRTPLGQGRRAWDWISGRDKESAQSIHHYHTTARKIARALPNQFNVRAATPAQIHWYRRHRATAGVIHQPMPPAGVGPQSLNMHDFSRIALDEGDNAARPWWRPSFKALVRVYDPDDPRLPSSYQTFLTVEHFPDTGIRFPRASYLHSLLNVETEAHIEWTQHHIVRTPDEGKAITYRHTKNIKDQMVQRGPRAADDDELPKKLHRSRAYTRQLGSTPAERELDHTVIIAVAAPTPDLLDDAVKQIRQELDTVGIVARRRRGAQLLLWKAFHTGSETSCPLEEFRIPTTAHLWSLFLPLISSRVGNIKGSPLAVDQTTLRPAVILHDPEGCARRNKNTGIGVVGDPGGGKSNRTKLSAFELILRGGRVVVFEPDTIAEWQKALTPIRGVRFIDPTIAQYCFDPLVIFPPHLAGRIAAAHILPWIGLPHDSILAKRYRRLLRPESRAAKGISSHRALMDYLRAQPGADDDELLLRLETAEEDFPGLFDDALPPYHPQDSPATVYLTGNLALPDAEDLTNAELYNKLSGTQRAGMAIYGLLIELEQRYMFERLDVFDVMIFEECAELCAFTTTARIAHKITRRGRKHATGIWLITQDYRDLAAMGDKFITQKWIFRVQDPELARETLRWANIDPDMYPELIVTLSEDTSPGNTRDEDLIDDGDQDAPRIVEAATVDPERRGEGFLVDELGRAARVQFFGAPTQEQADAFDSTAPVAA